jgi:iron-sulfur cluster repair protein YtfE (RIC family)
MKKPDVMMMYVVHHAFRRDLSRMRAAAAHADKPAARKAIADCWTTFHRYLMIHHTAEDEMLWPPIRSHFIDVDRVQRLLDQMIDEHTGLGPLLDDINDELAQASPARLGGLFADLDEALSNHFEHEETAALPLVRDTLSTREWDAFGNDQRRRVGLRGAGWFFPWLLDEAPKDNRDFVLALLPPPVRLIHRALWEPRYRRASPWQ